DLVLIDDLETFSVSTTVVDGELVYDERRGIDPTPDSPSHEYPEWFTDYVDAPTDPETFRVPADHAVEGTVRGIDYDRGLLSMETTLDPDRHEGALVAAPDRDVLKAALLDRHPDADGDAFVGFVTGFGFDRGAVATTLTWETPAVLAVGADDADMRSAVERVNRMNGGWAVVDDGEVLADLPAPVGGVVADIPVEETAERYGEVEATLRELGSDVDRPMLGLQTLSFFGVPALKLSFSGYADVMHGEIVGLAPARE
ncbi:MAG: adenine deaminase C-terminal domain-containing protein, partial [Halobacteriales archaeon]